jgi:hypothetical protein
MVLDQMEFQWTLIHGIGTTVSINVTTCWITITTVRCYTFGTIAHDGTTIVFTVHERLLDAIKRRTGRIVFATV